MKTPTVILVGLIALFSVSVCYSGQAQRNHQTPGHFYIIHFDYDESWASVPAVVSAQPHYSAVITK